MIDLQMVLCWNCGGCGHIVACCGSPGGILARHAPKRQRIEGPAGQTKVNMVSIVEVTDVGDMVGMVGARNVGEVVPIGSEPCVMR